MLLDRNLMVEPCQDMPDAIWRGQIMVEIMEPPLDLKIRHASPPPPAAAIIRFPPPVLFFCISACYPHGREKGPKT